MLHRHSLGMGLLTSLPLLSDLTWNTLSDEGTPLCTYTVGSPPKLMPQSAPLLASNNRGGRSESEEIPHVRGTKVNITSYQCFHLSCPQIPPAREGLGTKLCFHCLILQNGRHHLEIDASGMTSLFPKLSVISIQLLHTNTFTRPSHQYKLS